MKTTGSSVRLWTLSFLSEEEQISPLTLIWGSERATDRQREEGYPQDTITGERFFSAASLHFYFSPLFWAALHGRNVEAAFSRQDACFWNWPKAKVCVVWCVCVCARVCARYLLLDGVTSACLGYCLWHICKLVRHVCAQCFVFLAPYR